MLWAALRQAPDTGRSVKELTDLTGMSRNWVYGRLQALAATGQARRVGRGRWTVFDQSGQPEPA